MKRAVLLPAGLVCGVLLLLPETTFTQTVSVPWKHRSMLEAKASVYDNPAAKLYPVIHAHKAANPKTLEPEIKKEVVGEVTKYEGDSKGLVYSMTCGNYYDEPTSTMIMMGADDFEGDEYLNPYTQSNLKYQGNFHLDYWGTGNVSGEQGEDAVLDINDYNSLLGSDMPQADLDRDGEAGTSDDLAFFHGILSDSIPYNVYTNWDFMQDSVERVNAVVRFVDEDGLDTISWNNCGAATLQSQVDGVGVRNISGSGIDFSVIDTTKNFWANLPVYQAATVFINGVGHSINIVFVGGPNVDSTTNFYGWYCYDPQFGSGRVLPGDQSMEENGFVDVERFVYSWSDFLQEYVYNMEQVINFDLNNGVPSVSGYVPDVVTTRPEWQSHIHIGGEKPDDITVEYQYDEDFSDPSVTGEVEGAASWADVFYADSTTQQGSIYDSSYYNYDIFRDWWARSQDGLVIDTTYGSRDTTFFNRPPQIITVQDTEKPENTYNPGDLYITFTEYLEGIEDSEWEDNSGVVDVARDTIQDRGTDPTQCNYYNFTVDVTDVASDPTGNKDSINFNVNVSLDESYWSFFPEDASVPFYYPMIPDSTGGYAEAVNPVLGDLPPASYEMVNSTQDSDTTQPGHYEYDFDWEWSASDTICGNTIVDNQHVEVYKPESLIWTYIPADDTVTSEEGHDPSVTGGIAEAADTLLPWYQVYVNWYDEVDTTYENDTVFKRTFIAGPDIVGQQSLDTAYQYIYQVYVTGTIDQNGDHAFSIYPNPATETVTVVFAAEAAGTAEIVFLSAGGTPVLQKHIACDTPGAAKVQVPLHALPAGLYFVKVRSGNSVLLKKFVKR